MKRGRTGSAGPRIIHGGRGVALAANERAIREAVEAAFADRLRAAGRLGRLWLRWRMGRELSRRLEQIAPRGGLYARR